MILIIVIAVNTAKTMVETAKSFLKKLSFTLKLKSRFNTVIKSEAPGAQKSPSVFVSCASHAGLP